MTYLMLGGCAEEWHIRSVMSELSMLLIANMNHQAVLAMFLGSESHFTAVQKKCATPPHIHPMSRYILGLPSH